jgi:hypothetical protein
VIYGIGTDNKLYYRNNLNDSWNLADGVYPKYVKYATKLKNGTFLGIGYDNQLMTRDRLGGFFNY